MRVAVIVQFGNRERISVVYSIQIIINLFSAWSSDLWAGEPPSTEHIFHDLGSRVFLFMKWMKKKKR